MSVRGDRFVERWIALNVYGVAGQDDYSAEVECSAERIVSDALREGISAVELAETMPNINAYLVEQYELVCDPDRYF